LKALSGFLLFFCFFPREKRLCPDPGEEIPVVTESQAMNEPHEPHRTADVSGVRVENEPHDPNRTADVPSTPADSLDAGLAAGFGRPADGPGSVLAALRDSLGPLRPVLLREAEGESAHVVKPKSDAMPAPEETGTRYQLSGEIARGGMGAVLRGRDVDLGRDLAVKVLLEKHADRPEVVRRFIEEAQIGGQLQHPGVVPVYDIGRFGDRPFFTMKLVKGKTLAALLAERAEPSVDRPRFLAIALQVCQAMAYAHAKGVIHRDLKPGNIMVGAFGEVQVMDWGLAKVLAEGGVADEERASRQHQGEEGTLIRTVRSTGTAGSRGTDTEAGALLGTPAYMPPEQAQGDVALLDRRADVFGLGAILCEALTGKPPYVGRSAEEVRRKAANGDLADATARLDGCGADAELIALAKKCLAPEAIDRPSDAQEVADGLSAYQSGVQERLQTAQRERAVALAREAEQVKRRKVQLALAAALVALLLGGGAFAFWRNEQAQAGRERDARNAEAVAALLQQCEEALRANDAAKAHVALEAAKKRFAEGGAEKEAQRLGRLDADLALLRDLDAVDQFRMTVVDGSFPNPAVVATRTREALARFGADPGVASADEAAARVSASAVRARIVAALDRRLRAGKTAGVRAVLRRVDADPYRDAVRDAVLANDRAKVVALARRKDALEQPPGFAAFLGESGAIAVGRRRQLLQAAVSRRPGDLGLLMTLGLTHPIGQAGGADERLRWYQAAVAAAPTNPAALNNLGGTLYDKGQWDEAIACYQKAIALDPKFALAHSNLGLALQAKGKVEEAIACYQKAIALDPTHAGAHYNLGNALRVKGQLDEAIACYQKAIALDPTHAGAHNNLGGALYGKGQVDEAIACYKKAIALDPKFAKAHYNLGNALDGKGQVDEAIACYRKAIALDPKDANAHDNLGHALNRKGKVEEAIACFRKAITLEPKHANAHFNLGNALQARGQLDEAIACYKKAIGLDPKRAIAHYNLGVALRLKGQEDEAIACYRKALEFDPKLAAAHHNLGLALRGKGRVDEAIACYKKAIALDPKFAKAHYNLGVALLHKGQVDEAIASYQKAIEIDPKLAYGHAMLGQALLGRGRYAEARAATARALELLSENDPHRAVMSQQLQSCKRLAKLEGRFPRLLEGADKAASARESLDVALMCHHKRRNAAAARFCAGAFAADPKLADDLKAAHRYSAACYAALAASGQGEDAAKLDDKERTRLRKQALDWLRADLALRTRQLESGQPADRAAVQQKLRHWQKDSDLAGIRDRAALAKLSAEERTACIQLWADVAALLKRAGGPK
jgi:tetratricopeptide (TPR) repeat protein